MSALQDQINGLLRTADQREEQRRRWMYEQDPEFHATLHNLAQILDRIVGDLALAAETRIEARRTEILRMERG
jgi:hypothetical protein